MTGVQTGGFSQGRSAIAVSPLISVCYPDEDVDVNEIKFPSRLKILLGEVFDFEHSG